MNFKLLTAGAALIAGVLLCVPALGRADQSDDTGARRAKILRLLEEIKDDVPPRDLLGTDLVSAVHDALRAHRQKAIDKHVIVEIAKLLQYRDTRVYAAASLVLIGHRAKIALPALRRALKAEILLEQGEMFNPDTNAYIVICEALLRIGDRLPRRCKPGLPHW